MKIDDCTKKGADSTNMIPILEEDNPKLQNILSEQEKILEEIKENSKGALNMLCLGGDRSVIVYCLCLLL